MRTSRKSPAPREIQHRFLIPSSAGCHCHNTKRTPRTCDVLPLLSVLVRAFRSLSANHSVSVVEWTAFPILCSTASAISRSQMPCCRRLFMALTTGIASPLDSARALARTLAFFSGSDGVASSAPRSKVTLFGVEPLRSLEPAVVVMGGSCSPEPVDMRWNWRDVAMSMPRSSGRRLLMSPLVAPSWRLVPSSESLSATLRLGRPVPMGASVGYERL